MNVEVGCVAMKSDALTLKQDGRVGVGHHHTLRESWLSHLGTVMPEPPHGCYAAMHLPLLQITAPSEFQGNIIGDVNRRKGIIMGSEQEGDDVVIQVGWRAGGGILWIETSLHVAAFTAAVTAGPDLSR